LSPLFPRRKNVWYVPPFVSKEAIVWKNNSKLYLQNKDYIFLCMFLSCIQFLLGGVEIDQDNNIILLDEELASMRAGRSFLSQINDDIPRSRSAMAQMMTELQSQRRKSLTQAEFDSVLLSMVYSAHQAWHQEGEEERQAWGGLLLQLANVTLHELPLLTPPLASEAVH
uniref:Family with sequence similarity 180 member B n=1 Tax=Sphaeramia orbicularis TaxID=375764 RepID=A0A673A4B8_9TELE